MGEEVLHFIAAAEVFFWNSFTPDRNKEALISQLVLRSGGYISREVMSSIYAMFCGMEKDEQRAILSLAHSAKHWRENLGSLNHQNLASYSPSYAPDDDGGPASDSLGSFYMTSSKVKRGSFAALNYLKLAAQY